MRPLVNRIGHRAGAKTEVDMKFDIKHKTSGNILFSCQLPDDIASASPPNKLEWAVSEAMKSGADLRGADLCRADLRDADLCRADLCSADLRGADLRGADLCRADLCRADLRSADLRGADLRGADLRGADLRGADLCSADLRGADLRGADLCSADLRSADLRRADLCRVNLCRADLRDANLPRWIPHIDNIHRAVHAAASKPNALDMRIWHKTDACGTTHCRAGWVIHLAGAAGEVLEGVYGTSAAAALIYQASDPKLERIPDFYVSNETALADMQRLAEAEGA